MTKHKFSGNASDFSKEPQPPPEKTLIEHRSFEDPILSELERFSSQKSEENLSTGFSLPLTKIDTDALTPSESSATLNATDSVLKNNVMFQDRYLPQKILSVKETGIIQIAYDRYLGRQVALKKNRHSFTQNSRSEISASKNNPLKQEASITAILEHPNIVPLYDFQENTSGESYFTLRKMEGQSLQNFLKTSRNASAEISENKLLTIYLNICDAIRYAHSHQIVHLNLKTENVWVGDFGEVYVMNWGLAQFLHEPDPQKELTDIYALGLLLKECFSESASTEIQAIIQKATHINPQERYLSVSALIEEIKRYQNHMRILVKDYGPLEAFLKWTRRNPQTTKAGVLFLFVFLLFSLYLSWKETATRNFTIQECLDKANYYRQQSQYLSEISKEDFGKKLKLTYQALNAFHRAIELSPQPELFFQELIETGQEVIRICCVTKDYPLAQFVLREILKIKKLPGAYKIKLSNQFTKLKNATDQTYLERLATLESLFKTAPQSQEFRENALYEISRMRGNLVYERCLALLEEASRSLLNQSHNSQFLQFYLLLIEALGHSQNNQYAPFLMNTLRQIYHQILTRPIYKEIPSEYTETFIALAYALKDLNALEYSDELQKIFTEMQWYQRSSIPHLLNYVLESLAEGSVQHYSKILEKEPNNAKASYYRGVAYAEQNQLEKALQDLDRAIQLNPNYSDAYFNRGNVKIKKKDYSSAIDDFNHAIQINPQAWQIYTNRANAKELLKDFEGALQDYNKAIQINSMSPIIYNNRGITKHLLGDLDGALEDFNQAIQINPSFSPVYNNRGRLYRDQGQRDHALQDFTESIRLNPYESEAYLNRGMIKHLQNDNEGAIQDITQLIRLRPDSESGYLGRGVVKHSQGDFEGAIQDFTEAIRLNPSSDSYSLRGMAYLGNENFEKALHDFSTVIDLNPSNAMAYYNRGICQSYLEAFQEAVQDYTRSIQQNPNFVSAYYNRAINREALQDFRGALDDYNQALRLDPQLPEAYYRRGLLYRFFGTSRQAIDDFTQAIQFEPKLADAYLQRGNLYLRRDQELAKKDFQLFLDITKNTKEVEIQKQRHELLNRFPTLRD